ncbi:MAG TPA: MBL fold metallo-hydrolase [Vicinamibacterales bacterium]|jgi:7,8-dihydropterin-6-yl-methyl-4-(beta-D-ribofuranosyl)aminobenzene 5'-phosphate synthase
MSAYPWQRSISALTLLLVVPLGASSVVGVGVSEDRGRGDGGTASTERITVLYDAFGTISSMKKDWGFAALVEIGGRRILFDTGNNPEVFAQNVKTAGVDLRKLDFVVMSHRHGDHMGGMTYLLARNPHVKIYAPQEAFGVYGASLPGSFYRKDESLPQEMRYFEGQPPEALRFGAAWPRANIVLIDKTTEVAPGVRVIAQVSDAPGTKELKELSLAINTPEGIVLIVGCSHPGIEAIVAEAAAINPRIRFVAGGFHLVAAQDSVIQKVVAALHDTYRVERIAPGHCSGEHTFSEVKHIFGDTYQYAGVGTVVQLRVAANARSR